MHLICISVAAENTDSKSITAEDKTDYQKHRHQELLKLHVNKERTNDEHEGAAAVSAADGSHAVKDADESVDDSHRTRWLPGWNLSSITQLTGAVTSTVKRILKFRCHHHHQHLSNNDTTVTLLLCKGKTIWRASSSQLMFRGLSVKYVWPNRLSFLTGRKPEERRLDAGRRIVGPAAYMLGQLSRPIMSQFAG